ATAPDPDFAAAAVDEELTEAQTVLRPRRPAAPQDRPYPCRQLSGRERLEHVVVGAQIETGDARTLLATGAQQDHGHLARASPLAQELEASGTGEPHRQEDC